MKISYKTLLLALIPFSFISGVAFSADETVEQLEGERKSSSSRTSTSISTDRRSSSSSRKRSTKKKTTTTTTTSTQYSQDDCATKYMLGLDRECYNTNRVQSGGAYADCSDKTMADYYDIMDMQLSYIVGVDNFVTYKTKCDAYKGYALDKWLSSKGIIEKSAIKGSSECILATNKLTAAKKCYAAAIAHDGNFFEFGELMTTSCGEIPEVARKFSNAGDMGLSNIPQLLENHSTLQFTNKSENWRSAVEAVLAGYIYDARQACGEENYDLLELNQFTEDKRGNILSTAKESFVSGVASNLGRRAGNFVQTGSMAVGVSKNGVVLVPATSTKFYKQLDATNPKTLDKNIKRTFVSDRIYGDTTPQIKNVENISNIYVIEDVSSINKTRARLLNIISTGDIGTYDTQDEIDYAVITGLGGRANSSDVGIYDVISNISEGDTFVIKDTSNNCQILMINSDGDFEKLLRKEIQKNKSLMTYTSGCSKVIE
ncbi:MAG: hypothetical protein K6F04_01010 [bacterium]|nr:hypothetical protein [bacterium]